MWKFFELCSKLFFCTPKNIFLRCQAWKLNVTREKYFQLSCRFGVRVAVFGAHVIFVKFKLQINRILVPRFQKCVFLFWVLSFTKTVAVCRFLFDSKCYLAHQPPQRVFSRKKVSVFSHERHWWALMRRTDTFVLLIHTPPATYFHVIYWLCYKCWCWYYHLVIVDSTHIVKYILIWILNLGNSLPDYQTFFWVKPNACKDPTWTPCR